MYRFFLGGGAVAKPEGKIPPTRPRHSWEDNIEVVLRDGKAWTGLLWLRIGIGGGLL